MASNTDISLRNKMIYCVFVRNYSKEGTFEAVSEDLDRISGLGTDIIWLMPIHPCGVKHRKGSLGSPYSIRDYRDVNPEFGTKDDFRALVDSIHEHGMKCIIDVVYNHTSADSVLSIEHPEWFYHKPDGSFGNKVGDWWDVIDLDYSHKGLWDYQIDTLKMWAGDYGVDGFRCDVAPMVPIEFWERARAEVEKVHPGAIWLAESVEPGFIAYNRSHGVTCASDGEVYRAFDICYDYDIYDKYDGYLSGKNTLGQYSEMINVQESIYPDNYVKLRFLENHDRLRAAFLIKNNKSLKNWLAFEFFQKGISLIYNGQERCEAHTPGLFDKDTIEWEGEDLSALIRKLSDIKKNTIIADSTYRTYAEPHDIMVAIYEEKPESLEQETNHRVAGIFSMKGSDSPIHVNDLGISDGLYTNLINGRQIEVAMGVMSTEGEPIIIEL